MTPVHIHKSILKNQKGILTLDFIFAIIMIFTFTAILFAFSITFSAVEIAQYATFAASRAYLAGNKNSDDQEKAGKKKFDDLITGNKAVLGTFFKNGWFTLSPVELKNFNPDYAKDIDSDSDTFVGARTTIVAKILKMRFPLLGSTTDDDLSAQINSYLMREPTEEECTQFVNQRLEKIRVLDARFNSASYINNDQYVRMMDDGC